MTKTISLLSIIVLLLTELSCKKSPTAPQLPDQPIETTDRTQYDFSTGDNIDWIKITIHNGTDSTIYTWSPDAEVDFKLPDGTWECLQIRDDYYALGSIPPHTSATVSACIPNDDSAFTPGTYSFYSELIFSDSLTCATKGCEDVLVRTNSFTVRWK